MVSLERKARRLETAANGLTRREIHADLEAQCAGFDPREDIEALVSQRVSNRARPTLAAAPGG